MAPHPPRFLIRLLIVILSCFSFGFHIETPESLRAHEKEVRVWKKQIKKTYDLKALHTFLIDQIKTHPNVDGIDLSKAKVEAQWTIGQGTLSCGNWTFVTPNPKSPEFTIYWAYEDKKHADGYGGISKSVNFVGRRNSKALFELVTATHTEDEYIILSP